MCCRIALSILSLVFFTGLPSLAAAELSADVRLPTCTLDKKIFQNQMRKLWEDHVAWTRLYIVSVTANLDDKELVLDRLLRNQKETGDALKPFYGEATAKKMTTLLADHIVLAGRVVTDLSKRDTAAATKDAGAWEANADDIAAFLSTANPWWKLPDLKAAMRRHLEHTIAEAKAHVDKDWAGSIKAYDEGHGQILELADALSTGIVKQFSNKFCPVCPSLSCSSCP